MKDKLIAAIREVPISRTYEEYVEALADHLIDKVYPKTSGVEREIFEEIGKLVNEYLDGRIYTHDFCTYLVELKKKYIGTDTNVLTKYTEGGK